MHRSSSSPLATIVCRFRCNTRVGPSRSIGNQATQGLAAEQLRIRLSPFRLAFRCCFSTTDSEATTSWGMSRGPSPSSSPRADSSGNKCARSPFAGRIRRGPGHRHHVAGRPGYGARTMNTVCRDERIEWSDAPHHRRSQVHDHQSSAIESHGDVLGKWLCGSNSGLNSHHFRTVGRDLTSASR